jgi:hypothetical protein
VRRAHAAVAVVAPAVLFVYLLANPAANVNLNDPVGFTLA